MRPVTDTFLLGAELWFFWLSYVFLASFMIVLIALAIVYYQRVVKLKQRGR
jgi:hypothetical protein